MDEEDQEQITFLGPLMRGDVPHAPAQLRIHARAYARTYARIYTNQNWNGVLGRVCVRTFNAMLF